MTFSGINLGAVVERALDGDPTMASQSPGPQPEWPAASTDRTTRQEEEEDGEASFERAAAYRTRKLTPFLIPSDQDDVSSIDRPLETSALTPLGISALQFEDEHEEEEEGDLPPLSARKQTKESNTTPPRNDKDKQTAVVTPISPSPLRYKQRTNQQQRRELAKKILEHRKRTSSGNTNGKQGSNGTDGLAHDSPSAPSSSAKSSLRSPKYGTAQTRATAMDLTTENNDAATKSPESTDETVSWASTLTTDPSRLVTPSSLKLRRDQDDNSRQVPYLRMDTLPSVDENEEPKGRLDRHLLQQRSVASKSTKPRVPSLPLSLDDSDPFQQPQETETPRNPGTLHSHPSSNLTQPSYNPTQPSNNPSQPSSQMDYVLRSSPAILPDQRDDQSPTIRRTLSGSHSEATERYPHSAAPERSTTTAKSDPGGGMDASPLAQAATRWPHTPDTHRVSPLINYGNTADVLVTLHPGGETFEHSSHILAYASPVLRQKLQPVLGGWYRLELHQTTTVEWQLITPFLEPHSVQSAVVTPSNLSHLLPWFVQLQLDILLTECDQLLATLEFPKAHSTDGPAGVSKSVSSMSGPQVKDMVDIILLTEISCLGQLNSTCETSLETLESYLALHPGLAADSEAMPLLMRLLKDYPPIRQRLWRRSLVRFLPTDLPMFNEKEQRTGEAELVVVETMVYNSLFPFLLREGLSKAAREDEFERRTMDLEERWKRFRARQQKLQQTSREWDAAMIRENSILEDTRLFMDDSTLGSLSISRSERDSSVNTSKLQQQGFAGSPSPLTMMSAMCDDGRSDHFADWWVQCSKVAVKTRENSKTSLQQSLASIRSRTESQRLKQEIEEITRSERSRTHWLELILKRLNRQPIFPAAEGEQGEPGIPIPQAGPKDPRKFLC